MKRTSLPDSNFKLIKKVRYLLFLVLFAGTTSFTPPSFQIALLKYNGGGDWYANPTSLPNLAKFCNRNLNTNINEDIATVDVGSLEIINYPFLHMTGHGNVVFSDQEMQNLRNYLIAGGFLHIDDNYGMDKFIRPQLKKLFPELDLIELPFDHPIYHQHFDFLKGLPKIHEHDGKPPQGFGLIYEGRLIVFYTYECDLGDGWEDPEVHGDSDATRQKALQMGANILQYVFTTK
ncbi:MAG: DUF4159 domain-containing protein [Bacteroidales bacterium]|jgi:hypothetical protein|nr:DUF4159 domain-containing protein [Bacteroidales bacterium]